jgi:polar amino acid transport system substrate-binding protein
MRLVMAAALAVAAAASLTACGAPERTASIPRPTPPAASPSATTAPCTSPPTASYKPTSVYSPGSFPADSTMDKIVKKGNIVVGISADSRLLGSRNLVTKRFEGIDIEMANRVARALFADGWEKHLVFKTINAAQRIEFLQNGQVDMVARAMTMNCDRWSKVAFSEPYFNAAQQVLIRKGAKETSLSTLAAARKRVCATNGSTSIDRLRTQFKGAQTVGVPLTTDCLVLWQQGAVDAITGDDAILAGLSQQDPNAFVPPSKGVGAEPYGLAVKKENVDFVQFLNALLEQMRSNGDWDKAFAASGLKAVLPTQSQPRADFGRPVP